MMSFVAKALEKLIPIEEIGALMTPRIESMRNTVQQLNDAGIRKTCLYVDLAASLRQTEGEAQSVRRAKALVYHLEHVDTPIYEGEQLIGSVTGMWAVDPERSKTPYAQLREEAVAALDAYFAARPDELDKEDSFSERDGLSFEEKTAISKLRFGSLMARDHYDANIRFGDLQALIEEMTRRYAENYTFENWEIGSVLEKHFQYFYGEDTMRVLRGNGWNSANHTNLNYKMVVRCGLGDIRREIEARKQAAATPEKQTFYTACGIVMEGVSAFIVRYAQAAWAAAETAGEERARELRAMAGVMEKVSDQAPETFTEAIELVWLLQLIGNLFGGSALSLARLDQYLFPFYKNDIERGTITLERVRELLCSLYLKLNEPKMRTVQSLCVGGTKMEDGSDACNDLSKLCLETMALLKLPYPNMSARIDPEKTPDWFYAEVLRTIKAGCGQPMILNDKVWVPNLHSLGIPLDWARDYYNMGCTEIMIQGKDSNWITGGTLLLPKLLNDQLREAAEAGREYANFESFLAEYLSRVEKECDTYGEHGRQAIAAQRALNCDPFASSLIDGCLESGVDYFKGGSLCGDPCAINAQGLGTATDSLAVIEKFVFEERSLTIGELWEALRTDFQGQEALRRRLADGAPSYGNDEDGVDEIAKRVFDTYSAAVRRQNEHRLEKTRFVNNVFSYNMHITLGESLGATANGRHAGEAISDCVGPSQGCDTQGATALLNSVLKLSNKDVTGAYALNLKVSPSMVKDRAGVSALIQLIRVYLAEGGPQIQVNYQNPKDLLDAQIHPEKHRDLVVRIAGYCEYFINLDHRLQSEIIERTLHESA